MKIFQVTEPQLLKKLLSAVEFLAQGRSLELLSHTFVKNLLKFIKFQVAFRSRTTKIVGGCYPSNRTAKTDFGQGLFRPFPGGRYVESFKNFENQNLCEQRHWLLHMCSCRIAYG